MRSALLLAALLTAQSPNGDAQASRLTPGTRIRLTHMYFCSSDVSGTVDCTTAARGAAGVRPQQVAGALVRLERDSVVLNIAPTRTLALPAAALEALAVSRGKHGHRLAGAGVGFLVGAGVSFALLNTGGSNSLCDRSANQDAISSSECIGLAALGGIAGAGLGAVIGGLVRTERWQNVPLEHLRVNLTPHAGSKSGLAVVF